MRLVRDDRGVTTRETEETGQGIIGTSPHGIEAASGSMIGRLEICQEALTEAEAGLQVGKTGIIPAEWTPIREGAETLHLVIRKRKEGCYLLKIY